MMNCNLLAEREIENEQKHDAAPTTKKIDPIRFDSIRSDSIHSYSPM
jgi:hypothetical protein